METTDGKWELQFRDGDRTGWITVSETTYNDTDLHDHILTDPGDPTMPDAPDYTPYSIYMLEPHADHATAENGYIPIEAIAERVYGKPYSSLRGCQQDDEHIGNDSVKLYELTCDEDYLDALWAVDDAKLYLGWDSRTGQSIVKTGMTELDYWLSIRVADENTPATVEANPPKTQDLENAVFESRFFADRAFSPSLKLILADLIRRGELPRSNYLFRHWW